MTEYTHEQRYQSARCLMCGCCLEICPNFSVKGSFAGAIAPVNAFRILNEEQELDYFSAVAIQYKKQLLEQRLENLNHYLKGIEN